MEFDLCKIDWVAISAIVTLFMAVAAFWALYENRKQLNELKRQWQEKELENKKAKIQSCVINKDAKGHKILRISNTGKSCAEKISVIFLDNFLANDMHNKSAVKVQIMNNPDSPIEFLNAGDHFDIKVVSGLYCPTGVLKIKFTWEDDFSKQNENIQLFALYSFFA